MNFLLHSSSDERCDWGFLHWQGFSPPWYITYDVSDWLKLIFLIAGLLLFFGLWLFPIKIKRGG